VILRLDLSEHSTSVPFSPIIALGTLRVDIIGRASLAETLDLETLNVIPIDGYNSIVIGRISTIVYEMSLDSTPFSTDGIVTVHLTIIVFVVHSNNIGSPGQIDTVSQGRSSDIIFFPPVCHQTAIVPL
jgi:hypothetical protein